MTDEDGLLPLSRLGIGSPGTVECLEERTITPRLRELGFSRGVTVECVGKNPRGGMRAYSLRGSVIALRQEDAAAVLVRSRPTSAEKNGNEK